MADQPAQTTVFRAALRREKIAARQALPEEMHALASAHTLAHLSQMLKPRPPGVIAFCWPVRAEVDCRPLMLDLIRAGWQAAMPMVTTPAAPMEFRAWTPDAPMTTDPFGIPVPQTTHCVTPAVVLLPLVAADPTGYRLGYGGGYFDRTLAVSVPRPLTIGVGFELAIVPDIHPEPHDIPLDIIVTETGVRLMRSANTSGLSISSV
ncbi:MAG: 5-formyltetrahydrofolate cyclo-ligase [Rhodocyclaceae bacterium]|nr:5-formyltetrahydrofolate cyclo-ligase [Rhodocyclaceae bacterium]